MPMPTLQGHTRTAFLCFFASHIPITLLIDGQALFPRHYYPKIFRDAVDWYATTFKDKLLIHPPTWFSSLIAIEFVFQVPFFLLAVYAIARRSHDDDDDDDERKGTSNKIQGDGVFRSLCMIYGSSTATTLIPIFASIFTQRDTTVVEKAILLCFYLPYIIFPLWLVVIAVCEENVFGKKMGKKSN
ncbi:hypothetical protein ACHAW5_004296 [Stephanodiscus triporus]|uniref:EXPERA domain-containing protein n=1 Tax=Stephanodiscus triporus TaxID=2934178 RepID=A0ABD3Q2X2_9STRA